MKNYFDMIEKIWFFIDFYEESQFDREIFLQCVKDSYTLYFDSEKSKTAYGVKVSLSFYVIITHTFQSVIFSFFK